MNILVLATGGTIGSAAENGVIAPNADSELLLLQAYRTQYAGKAHFEIQKICAILSENADDRFYETLITALQDVDPNAYAGVIVLHGTDTLSYTAALCAMACRSFPLPVCFVSSAYVLSDARQNGVANFHAAVRYIESGYYGFVVSYRNRNGETQIHLATRILEADPFLADFHSAMAKPLAIFRDGCVELLPSPALPTQTQLREMRSLPVKRVSFQKSVFPLKLFPNLALDAISPDPNVCGAVLLFGYHSGTAPEAELTRFARRMEKAEIPVYLSPASPSDTQYASADALLRENILPLYGMTAESALAKLKLACNQSEMPRDTFLRQTLYFETVQP